MNDSDYSEFDMSESTPRDFDIVVYGATGFTGAGCRVFATRINRSFHGR